MLKSHNILSIALEFECENCLKQHVFYFTDSTTHFQIKCECGKILQIKPIEKIRVKFEYFGKRAISRNHPQSNNENIKKAISIVGSYGYDKKDILQQARDIPNHLSITEAVKRILVEINE